MFKYYYIIKNFVVAVVVVCHLGGQPHTGFKANECVMPEKRGPFYNGRNPTSASYDGWQYHPFPLPQTLSS